MKFARTIRFDAAPVAAERAALERSIAAASGSVAWRDDASTGRTYALVETPEPIELGGSGTAYAGAIIALAVTPRPPEAFPTILEALTGAGRPTGVLSADRIGDELALEWDPSVSPASLVMAVLDTELRRFAGSRMTRSLAPLPLAVTAAVAAGGLGAPEIAPDRVLETYLGRRMDAVKAFLFSVGPTDLLDVIATSVLIYYVLLLIRGTRAVQILIGVLVLIGLLGIANLLRLYLLGSILQIIVVGAAVTLPIVFQPELRRALEQIGRGGLFRMAQDDAERRPEDRSILAIAQVAFALSRSRIGALIVIEQQTGLKEYIESGTLLNALVSVELLVSLFQPRSPLHDGAVIIQEDLIEAAGCFLPLAEQSLAERRVGTRHRAALGLSEQTDAVVVVVSEESGSISVAREGKLSRPIEDEARLNNILLAVTRRRRATRVTGNDLVSHLRARLLPHRTAPPPPGETRGDNSQELRT